MRTPLICAALMAAGFILAGAAPGGFVASSPLPERTAQSTAPVPQPQLAHLARFEQNARPSTNVEDMRGAPTVCAPPLFGGRCTPPAGSARAAIEDAIDAFIAVDCAIEAVAKTWR